MTFTTAVEPILLRPNSIEHKYLGGELIAVLRGGAGGPNRPEEWLGSTTTRFGTESAGLTTLETGATLRALIERDPVRWLGQSHIKRFGTSTALLVKLIHAGQRLPVHLHPSRSFAARHLDCPFGKSEAWLILDRDRADTTVYVGTNRPVERTEWEELITTQDGDAMLALLNPIKVEVGDGVFVPAGTPHAIGEGLLVLELQEPTDFSILLEWEGFEFDGPREGHLGLGFDVALEAINPDPLSQRDLDELTSAAAGDTETASASGLIRALPATADPYFDLHRTVANTPTTTSVALPQSFGVLLVTDGHGSMRWAADASVDLTAGDAYVIPHGCGSVEIVGSATAFFAAPPRTGSTPPVEFDA